MADYRELLRRAIEALPENSGVNRRAVYEKARSALVTQLRAIEPPLPAREITTHRLALEDCIREVEQEATDLLLGNLRRAEAVEEVPVPPSHAPEPVEPVAEVPEPSGPDADEPVVAESAEADVTVYEASDDLGLTEEAAEPETEIAVVEDENNTEPLVAERFEDVAPEVVETIEMAPEPADADDRFDEPVIVPQDEPDVAHAPEPGSIEEIIALAQQSVERHDAVEPAADDGEPVEAFGAEDAFGDAPAPEAPSEPVIDLPLRGPVVPTHFEAVDEGDPLIAEDEPAAIPPLVDLHGQPLRSASGPDDESPENVIAQAMSSVREVDVEAEARSDADISDAQVAIDRAIAALDREARGEGGETAAEDGTRPGALPLAEKDAGSETGAERERGGGLSALTVFLLVAVLLLGGAGIGGYWAWREGYIDLNTVFAQGEPGQQVASTDEPEEPVGAETPEDMLDPGNTTPEVPALDTGVSGQTMPGEELPFTDTETPAPETSTPEASFEDRLPAEAEPRVNGTDEPIDEQTIEMAAAGPQSLLLEEQPSGATGAVPYSGSVQWSRGADELGHPTIVAQATIPARNLEMRMVLRRNADSNLPASHLMEVNFIVAETFVGGSIASLPGVMLKDEELIQGQPLTGASARIVGNSFLFALSSASERDVETNEALLADRSWLDLAMVYGTGRRAILTLEKGEAGETIFNEVLDAWAALDTPAASEG